MKILIIGAGRALGKLIVPALSERHEVITAGRNCSDIRVSVISPCKVADLVAGYLRSIESTANGEIIKINY